MDATALENRIRKTLPRTRKWAARVPTTAFRAYDFDMPEFPYAIDIYGDFAHVLAYPPRRTRREGSTAQAVDAACGALARASGIPADNIFVKVHEPHAWGKSQYLRQSRAGVCTHIDEAGARFEINLSDFLDAGLFLDHRQTRLEVRAQARGKDILNLFAYTGSFSVQAALGGARRTVSVDLSARYCAWAGRNLVANALPTSAHRVIEADVLGWLEQDTERWDVIILDPPTFSSSEKTARRFEIQRDHPALLGLCIERLRPGGQLYFSTNYLQFALHPDWTWGKERTAQLKAPDLRRTLHRCWQFTRPHDGSREMPHPVLGTTP